MVVREVDNLQVSWLWTGLSTAVAKALTASAIIHVLNQLVQPILHPRFSKQLSRFADAPHCVLPGQGAEDRLVQQLHLLALQHAKSGAAVVYERSGMVLVSPLLLSLCLVSRQLEEDTFTAWYIWRRSCKIDEGAAGVRNCMWAPDGLSVLVVADFQIRISIISLVDSSVKVMRGPKFADQGIAFSPDGRLLAYAEVRSSPTMHLSS